MLRVLLVSAFAVFFAAPALAGVLAVDQGQLKWTSTDCPSPMQPDSVLKADREAKARHMNSLVEKHNDYVGQVQTYMDCLSNEAKRDADKASQDIIDAAQTKIIEAQSSVEEAAAPLQGKDGE